MAVLLTAILCLALRYTNSSESEGSALFEAIGTRLAAAMPLSTFKWDEKSRSRRMIVSMSDRSNQLVQIFTNAITRDDTNTSTLVLRLDIDELYKSIRKTLFGRYALEELGEDGPAFGRWPASGINAPFNSVFRSFEHGAGRRKWEQLRKYFIQGPSVVIAEKR